MSAQLVSIPLKQLQTVQHARKEKEHRIAETVACSHIQHSIYSHYFWIFTAFVDYKVQNKICKNCQHRISLRKLGERIKRIEFNDWIVPYWRSCSLKSPYEKKRPTSRASLGIQYPKYNSHHQKNNHELRKSQKRLQKIIQQNISTILLIMGTHQNMLVR